MATDHISHSYASLKEERQPKADRIRTWVWRNREHLMACTASGAFGLLMTAAGLYSLCIHY